jgi:hypothetical protein
VKVGVVVRPSDDLGTMRALEAAGVDVLWFESGDPIVMASAAAVVTSRVSLTVVLEDPTPVAAKAVASLDALCGGRSRVVVSSEDGLLLLRTLLSPASEVPIRPRPVQERIPVWTTNRRLAGIADGLVVDESSFAGEVEHVAVMVRESDPFSFDVEEVVLSLADGLWETVGKVVS